MNKDLLKSLGKDLTVLITAFGFALMPLPLIDGNPTGLKLVLDEWHRLKAVQIIDYIVSLDDNTYQHSVKMDEIKAAEFDTVSHKWVKPKRYEYDDTDEFKDELDTWRQEYKEKKELLDKLKSERGHLKIDRRQLIAQSAKASS